MPWYNFHYNTGTGGGDTFIYVRATYQVSYMQDTEVLLLNYGLDDKFSMSYLKPLPMSMRYVDMDCINLAYVPQPLLPVVYVPIPPISVTVVPKAPMIVTYIEPCDD